jgi:hypothetical protein
VTAGNDIEVARTSANSRLLATANGVANIALGFNNSGVSQSGMDNNTGYVNVLQGYPLLFGTSSTERMRITSNGNVLIGTKTDNGARLSIAGGRTFINTGQSASSTAAYTAFNNLTFNDDFSDVARGPNKIITYGRGTTWVGGIGIHNDTQAYYAGGTHKWYKYNGTTATLNLSLDGSGNVIATGSVTATSIIPSGSTIPTNVMYLPSANIIAFSTNTNERMSITSTGDILFKGKDTTGSLDARFINNGNDLAFYASTNTGGPSKSISFHGRWLANELRMRISINGNVLIGTDTDTSDKLRVGGNTFTDTITTLRPDTESKSVAWRLGVVSGGTTTPDRLIRVMVGGIEYNIPAREA